MMGWNDAKKEHGAGLFHSGYKSDDYKKQEKKQYDKDIKQVIDMANKGKK